MRKKIIAGGVKVFITAISVFTILPLDYNINREIFVAVFVYLLSRSGECVFLLADKNSDNSIMRTTLSMIWYFVFDAFAAACSWRTEFANSDVAFFALYVVCSLTLVGDIVDVILCAESYQLMAHEVKKKKR